MLLTTVGSMIISDDDRARGGCCLGNDMARRIGSLKKCAVVVGAIIVAATLTACQDYRNAFNPIQVLCPGDFDPAENRCVIQTHGNADP